MIPPASELFRALLRRALGGRLVAPTLLLAITTGSVTGWVAGRCLGAGMGARPSAGGVLAWLLVNFDHTALYGLGAIGALQLCAFHAADARSGWAVQYLAAGGTRDRYIVALAGAETAACALLYLLAAGAWLTAATVFGRPVSQLASTTALLPVAIVWLSTPCAFSAAAVALTGAGGRAMLGMAAVVVAPWLALAALRPDPAFGAPAWLVWTTAVAPPYPIGAGVLGLFMSMAYSALLLALAWAVAPRRLLFA